jgi:putative glutamine amidotransferase
VKILRIGISANFLYPDKSRKAYPPKNILFGEESLYQWIAQGGAIPYMIPRLSSALSLRQIVQDLDGIVFSGGADMSPKSYGEDALKPEWQGDYERDQYEIELFHTALTEKKPVLGICRGHQLINVALKGTLFQDIQTQNERAQCHRDGVIYDALEHEIKIVSGTLLDKLYPHQTPLKINSIHHQAIKDLGEELIIQAYSVPDHIIEAIWLDRNDQYVLGVQWHPEWIKNPYLLDSKKIRDHFLGHIAMAHSLKQ